jgi:unsaturated rhamnogalacturonyl hydrolase
MSVLPLTMIGLLFDRPHYISEATYQFILHAQYLVDTTTGLWFHGWQFTDKGGHNFARALWARGNSWITIAIPIFLEILGDKLPKDSPDHKFLVSTWRRQVERLITLQDEKTGLWHTLLLDATSYVETSASAGFCAGIFMGLRNVRPLHSSSLPS